MELGALIDDLGCSPFDYEAYPPQSISQLPSRYSEFGSLREGGKPPLWIQCSTPESVLLRLTLKLFRRGQDISKFDWPFTPIHNSSKAFSTDTSSDLHTVLPVLHPGHG